MCVCLDFYLSESDLHTFVGTADIEPKIRREAMRMRRGKEYRSGSARANKIRPSVGLEAERLVLDNEWTLEKRLCVC